MFFVCIQQSLVADLLKKTLTIAALAMQNYLDDFNGNGGKSVEYVIVTSKICQQNITVCMKWMIVFIGKNGCNKDMNLVKIQRMNAPKKLSSLLLYNQKRLFLLKTKKIINSTVKPSPFHIRMRDRMEFCHSCPQRINPPYNMPIN